MFSNKFIFKITPLFLVVVSFTSYSNIVTKSSKRINTLALSSLALDIYKSPTCSCCGKWISHVNENGFNSKTHNFLNLSPFKEKTGIKPKYQSCHTAISKEGYIFEGHITAKFIKQFLNEKHGSEVIGISVPGMPIGSSGMSYGDKFMPYDVLLLKSDGIHEVYKSVKSNEEQYQ